MSTADAAPKRKTTLAQWKKAAVHTITLATGTVVDIKIPNLPELVSAGEFPNHLVDVAIAVATGDTKITTKEVEAQAEFYRHLMSKTLVEPAVTPDEAREIPFEDVELLAALATRQRDVDALGKHIAGLDNNEDWRKFRGLSDLD
jgi:hypothetical protein